MSNKQQPSTTKLYVSLSIKELQALGKVSGEAMRVYVAIASHAFGEDVACFPRWKKIRQKMGKKTSDRRLKEIAVILERENLIRRFNHPDDDKRWFYLPLKAEVIKERKKEEEGEAENKPPGGSNRARQGGSKQAREGGSNRAPINNSIENRNEDYSNNEIMKKEIEEWLGEETEERFPGEKVKLSNGNQCSLKNLVDDFLEQPAFITFYPKQDQETILKFLEENNYGVVVRSLKKEISRE